MGDYEDHKAAVELASELLAGQSDLDDDAATKLVKDSLDLTLLDAKRVVKDVRKSGKEQD